MSDQCGCPLCTRTLEQAELRHKLRGDPGTAAMTARILTLVREQPGPSEVTRTTGVVAEACVFSDGSAVLRWLTNPGSTESYASEKDMRKIREFSGRSRFCEERAVTP